MARSVGLVTNSVTYYFRRKEDLAAACLLRAMDAVVDEVVADAARRHARAERVEAFIHGYLGVLADIEGGRWLELVRFHDVRALTAPQRDVVFDAYGRMYRGIRVLVAVDGASRSHRRAQRAGASAALGGVLHTRLDPALRRGRLCQGLHAA